MYAVIPFLALCADRITKYLARQGRLSGVFARGCVSLEHVENDALAGGLGRKNPQAVKYAHTGAMLALPALLLPGLAAKSRMEKTGIALLLCGGGSNLFDRLRRGTVTDMLRFPRLPGKLRTLVWNIADLMLLAGLLLTVIGALRRKTQR